MDINIKVLSLMDVNILKKTVIGEGYVSQGSEECTQHNLRGAPL